MEGHGGKHLLQSCLERLRQGKQAIILDVKWTLVQVACTDNVSEILAMYCTEFSPMAQMRLGLWSLPI